MHGRGAQFSPPARASGQRHLRTAPPGGRTRALSPPLLSPLPQGVQAHAGRVHHRPGGPHAADDQGPSQQPGEAGAGWGHGTTSTRSPHPAGGCGGRGSPACLSGAPGCGFRVPGATTSGGGGPSAPFLAGDVLGVPGVRRQLRQGERRPGPRPPPPGSPPPGGPGTDRPALPGGGARTAPRQEASNQAARPLSPFPAPSPDTCQGDAFLRRLRPGDQRWPQGAGSPQERCVRRRGLPPRPRGGGCSALRGQGAEPQPHPPQGRPGPAQPRGVCTGRGGQPSVSLPETPACREATPEPEPVSGRPAGLGSRPDLEPPRLRPPSLPYPCLPGRRAGAPGSAEGTGEGRVLRGRSG